WSRRGDWDENSACIAARPNTIIASFVHCRIKRLTRTLCRTAPPFAKTTARRAKRFAAPWASALRWSSGSYDSTAPCRSIPAKQRSSNPPAGRLSAEGQAEQSEGLQQFENPLLIVAPAVVDWLFALACTVAAVLRGKERGSVEIRLM